MDEEPESRKKRQKRLRACPSSSKIDAPSHDDISVPSPSSSSAPPPTSAPSTSSSSSVAKAGQRRPRRSPPPLTENDKRWTRLQTVKIAYNSLFRRGDDGFHPLDSVIENAVKTMSMAAVQASILTNLHVIRCLDDNLPILLDQSFFNSALIMLCSDRAKNTTGNEELWTTFVTLYRSEWQRLPRLFYDPDNVRCREALAGDMETNAKNYMMTTFRSRHRQWCKDTLAALYDDASPPVTPTSTTTTKAQRRRERFLAGQWLFSQTMIADDSEMDVAALAIRAKCDLQFSCPTIVANESVIRGMAEAVRLCRSFVGQRPVTKKNLSSPKTHGVYLQWMREILRERERDNELHAGRKQKRLFGLVPIRHLKAQYVRLYHKRTAVWEGKLTFTQVHTHFCYVSVRVAA